MIALNVEDVGHFLAVGKTGRVHHNEVELPAFPICRLKVLEHVGADDFVPFRIDAVQFKIAFRPIEISVGQIDGFAGCRAAGGGIDGEAAGVGKQVQKTFAHRRFADFFARISMIQKKPRIQILIKVDPKLTAVFGDDEIVARLAGFLVLLQTFLAFAAFEADLFGRKTGNEGDGFQYFGKPRFVFFEPHQPAGIVFLKVDSITVNIGGKRELGNVAVVNAPGFDAVAFRPFHEVFDVFAHAVGEGSDVGHGFRRNKVRKRQFYCN